MSRYAETTEVSTGRSRDEIECTLQRYGATEFVYGWNESRAVVGFRMRGRMIKLQLPLPDRQAREFTHTPGRGLPRSTEQAAAAWEQACRQRWRALALVIKAKLEAVEAGIVTFEEEFLAHTMLPSGQTYGEFALPQLAAVYERQEMPRLLPWVGNDAEG
jgi:hypothetical protein